MYLTYTQYQDMGGTLDEAAFNDFEFEAEMLINWYTFNRLKKPEWTSVLDTDELKKCVYKLIKLAQERQAALTTGEATSGESTEGAGASIASRSNDGVSISYNVISAKDVFDTLKTEMESTVRLYLSCVVNELGRKVLYRGLYPGE